MGSGGHARSIAALVLLVLLPALAYGNPGPDAASLMTATSGPTPLAAPSDGDRRQRGVLRRTAGQRAEGRRLARRSRSVRGALRRALLTGHISRSQHDADRRTWRWAERLARTNAELDGVLSGVADLATRRKLTRSRLPLAFLTVRTNIAARGIRAAPGTRRSFGRDPRVWQAVAGQGWQVHHLATASRLNGLAKVCLTPESRRRSTCRPAALRRAVDALASSATRRSSFLAWESLYRFGGTRPGWISGMTQATAIQALTRGAAALRRTGDLTSRPARARDGARDALRAFERRPPVGVGAPAGAGRIFVLYSDVPQLLVLNAHLQALIGLREANDRGLSRRAGRAFRDGLRGARVALKKTDTGAWSRYAVDGSEATLDYQRLTTRFLRDLCDTTRRGLFCAPANRFARYLNEPPRLSVGGAPRVRARRGAGVAVYVSKVSNVRVRIASGRGRVLNVERRLERGRHRFGWEAPRRGRYDVVVTATAINGRQRTTTRTVRALRPR